MVEYLKKIFRSGHGNNFLIKTLMFLVLLICLDLIVGHLLSFLYFKQNSGYLFRTTYTIEKTTDEILVFGSSKAAHHYKPSLLEKELKMSCYNSGRDGSSIYFHYALLRAVLERYKPEMVILDIRPAEFQKDVESYDRLSSLLPYYKKHKEIRSIVELKSPYEKLKILSSIYPFNSLMFSIFKGIIGSRHNNDSENKGYVPLWNTSKKSSPAKGDSQKYSIDRGKTRVFERFIKDCLDKNINLVVVNSPSFLSYKTGDQSIIIADSISSKHSVKFIDYSNDSLFLNTPLFFSDNMHLNDDGASVFTKLFIKRIR